MCAFRAVTCKWRAANGDTYGVSKLVEAIRVSLSLDSLQLVSTTLREHLPKWRFDSILANLSEYLCGICSSDYETSRTIRNLTRVLFLVMSAFGQTRDQIVVMCPMTVLKHGVTVHRQCTAFFCLPKWPSISSVTYSSVVVQRSKCDVLGACIGMKAKEKRTNRCLLSWKRQVSTSYLSGFWVKPFLKWPTRVR